MCRDPFGIDDAVEEKLRPVLTHNLGVSKSHSVRPPVAVYCPGVAVLEPKLPRDRSLYSRIGCSSKDLDRSYDYLQFGLNIVMALSNNPFAPLTTTTSVNGVTKKVFSRTQPTTDKYLQAVNQTQPLTMLTADEVKNLSLAGQQLVGTDETLIYKYREEFLHVQQVAEKGLTNLDLLVEDPSEFKIVAEAWGFTVTVKDKYTAGIVYTKNLNATEFKTQISNINIDWSKPNPPTIDVEYYRYSGNLVNLADSTIVVPNLENIKARYNVNTYLPSAVSTTSNSTAADSFFYIVKNVDTGQIRTSSSGYGANFKVFVSEKNGVGQPYTFYKGSAGGGENYSVGDRLLVTGLVLGGLSPRNDAVITVLSVGQSQVGITLTTGIIVSASIEGTSGFVSPGAV